MSSKFKKLSAWTFFKEPLEFCKMNGSIKVSYHWPKKKLYTCTCLAGPAEPRGQKGIAPPPRILTEFESKPVPSKDSITIYNQKTLYYWLPTQIFRPSVGSASSWRDFFSDKIYWLKYRIEVLPYLWSRGWAISSCWNLQDPPSSFLQ